MLLKELDIGLRESGAALWTGGTFSPSGLAPPEVKGYVLGERLGHGGQGTVWRAADGAGREVAIKICLQETELLWVEVQNLKAVRHPNVVKFEVFVKPNAIVMEFIDGQNLKTRLEEEAGAGLEVEEAMWVMRGLLRGVSVLHEKTIIHQDIKPENIMLRAQVHGQPSDRVVIIDLGTSKQQRLTQTLTQAWTFLGNPAYASPEKVVGCEPEPGNDVWAAGVVFFEMLEGSRPFAGKNNVDLMHNIRLAAVRPLQVSPATVD
ncbi:kinase-like domain-containing protein [Baffinella frigidus]|nr:kinase-like domain-containing protein [Cryptophyta sp. CCMP2293]